MSDSTSVLKIQLLTHADLAAIERTKERAEALTLTVEGLRTALATLALPLSFEAALEGIKNTVEYGASIKHLSEQAGISTDAFQALTYAAADAGLKQEELSTALNMLQRNMAQAADGATKQNRAIADLGLSTAELLAMPVEKQIEAIGAAYVNATDKGKAWADVIALLGRNSARVKEMLENAGKNGIGKDGLILNAVDIDRAEHLDKLMDRFVLSAKAAAGWLLSGFIGASTLTSKMSGAEKPSEKENQSAEEIRKRLEETVSAKNQVIAADNAMARAIAAIGKADETHMETAKRLRTEADEEERQAARLDGTRKTVEEDRIAYDKLMTEAAKRRQEANKEDAKDAKEKAQYNAAELDFYAKMFAFEIKGESVQEQLIQAKAREVDLSKQLDGLDEKSTTKLEDAKRLWHEIEAVKKEIIALDDRSSREQVRDEVHLQEVKRKMEAIKLLAIEHDWTKTTTEKWYAKRDAIKEAMAEQIAGVARLRAQSRNPGLTQSARDEAGNKADSAQDGVDRAQQSLGGMGPDPHSFAKNFKADLTQLQNQWGTLEQEMARGLTGTIVSGMSSVENHLARIVKGTESWGQGIRNVALEIGDTLLRTLVHIGVQMTANAILAKVLKDQDKKNTKEKTAGKMAEAAFESIAQLGPIYGPIVFAAEFAAIEALSAGYEEGGFTGGREGMPAGIVHGGEFVFSAPAVRTFGAANLERAHMAAIGGGGNAGGSGVAGNGSVTLINAYSDEDVARAQRRHVDAQIVRQRGKLSLARVAM